MRACRGVQALARCLPARGVAMLSINRITSRLSREQSALHFVSRAQFRANSKRLLGRRERTNRDEVSI